MNRGARLGCLTLLLMMGCRHSNTSAAGEREPSETLLTHWSPPAQPSFYAYADLGSLLRTDIIQQMMRTTLAVANPSQKAMDCISQISHASREAAAVGGDAGHFIVITYDTQALRTPIEDCVRILGGPPLKPIPNREGVYELPSELLAILPGALLVGSPSLVESSLAHASKGGWAKDVVLPRDKQLVFSSKSEKLNVKANLSVSQSHFVVEAAAKFTDEMGAKAAAEATSLASIESQLSELNFQNPSQLTHLIQQLPQHWQIRQEQNTIKYSFSLEGTPQDMAPQVGAVAAIWIAKLRRFILMAKTAEARAAVRSIADHLVKSDPIWLESFPAVPASMGMLRGTKYQSVPGDWIHWQAINLSFGDPQYFQYRVDAAADGKSAKVVAQGDLNGDGKLSSFSLLITLDPKTHHSTAAQELEEHDPLE